MKEWAECGNSTNRSRVTKMLEADAKDPRVVGLCSNLISSYGIGGKGGGAALTRVGKDINGNITLFSCQGADEDGHMNLQKINFNLKEAQRRQVWLPTPPGPPAAALPSPPPPPPRPRHSHSPAALPHSPATLRPEPRLLARDGRLTRMSRRGTASTRPTSSSRTSRS